MSETNKVTADTILEVLNQSIQQHQILDANIYLDCAAKLSLLVGEETDKLFELQQQVAKSRVEMVDGGASVALAKLKAEASDEYRQAMVQRAKVDRILEMCRISKLRARMAIDEMYQH